MVMTHKIIMLKKRKNKTGIIFIGPLGAIKKKKKLPNGKKKPINFQ